ncbi:acyl-CoA thioesterase [Priestia aryabhattai]|uniref:acyl-CoA thioesterase n=1 Tax=Priestia aryabhattai TaxID=412384 RepID=UPI00368C30C2
MADLYISCNMEMSVTWGDCDAAGISYYAKNFEWFTNAYMQLLAKHGFPYMETFHKNGIYLVCLKADCQYKKMIRPLEKITIKTFLSVLTRTRVQFTYQVIKDNGEIAAEGFTSHAYVSDRGHPFNLQKRFPILWEKLDNRYNKHKDYRGI